MPSRFTSVPLAAFVAAIALSIAVAAQPDQGVTMSVAPQDQDADRTLTVVAKPGKTVPHIRHLVGFEPQALAISISDEFGAVHSVPLADVERLDFEQTPRRSSPVAQQCPWHMETQKGATTTLTVPRDKLQIAPDTVTLLGVTVPASAAGSRWELLSMRYQEAAFLVAVQPVVYKRIVQACGGSGGGKGVR